MPAPLPDLAAPARAADDDRTLHEHVYQTVRRALIVGRIAPGKGLSLRRLAEALGVGVMPARDAIRRLSAEQALEVRPNRRVYVPTVSAEQFDELMRARMLIEPECAVRALPAIDPGRLARIVAHDAAVNRAFADGDAEAYMAANHAFHFEIYRASPSDVLVPLLEGLWVRFGPFMRTVYGVVGTAEIEDKHALAVAAIRRRDAAALKAAIEADIRDGMTFLGQAIFSRGDRRRAAK